MPRLLGLLVGATAGLLLLYLTREWWLMWLIGLVAQISGAQYGPP